MKLKRATNIGLGFAIFLFIISFAVVFTLNFTPLYDYTVDSVDLAGSTGYSEEMIKGNYATLIEYNSILYDGTLDLDGFAMSDEGRIHFEEVKDIFELIQIILIISTILVAVGLYYKIKRREYGFMPLAGICTIVIPSVMGLMIASNWTWFFIKFHEIAFDNDYWIFNPTTDPIITILPDTFFMYTAIMVVSIILLLSIEILVAWFVIKRKNR